MGAFEIIFAILGIAEKLIDRAAQTGELSESQKAVLSNKATGLFDKYSTPPPAPPGA